MVIQGMVMVGLAWTLGLGGVVRVRVGMAMLRMRNRGFLRLRMHLIGVGVRHRMIEVQQREDQREADP